MWYINFYIDYSINCVVLTFINIFFRRRQSERRRCSAQDRAALRRPGGQTGNGQAAAERRRRRRQAQQIWRRRLADFLFKGFFGHFQLFIGKRLLCASQDRGRLRVDGSDLSLGHAWPWIDIIFLEKSTGN